MELSTESSLNNGELIMDNNGIKIFRKAKNNYKITFFFENRCIDISKIIDFSLFQILYELNTDIFEYCNIEKDSTNTNANITLLIKNIFEDIGINQQVSYINIQKHVTPQKITFISNTIKDHHPRNIPTHIELLDVNKFICECDIVSLHRANFTIDMIIDNSHNLQSVIEKTSKLIFKKIFKRIKQFIENIVV